MTNVPWGHTFLFWDDGKRLQRKCSSVYRAVLHHMYIPRTTAHSILERSHSQKDRDISWEIEIEIERESERVREGKKRGLGRNKGTPLTCHSTLQPVKADVNHLLTGVCWGLWNDKYSCVTSGQNTIQGTQQGELRVLGLQSPRYLLLPVVSLVCLLRNPGYCSYSYCRLYGLRLLQQKSV